MGKVIEFRKDAEIEQARQEQNHQDLDMYRRLGILEVFTLQGDNDEDVELQFKRALEEGEKIGEVIYANEPGEDRLKK